MDNLQKDFSFIANGPEETINLKEKRRVSL
jgi:hypothetical protein